MSVDLAALPVRPLPTADGRLASLVPGGRTVAVPGTAHHPKLADPARFNAELSAFLEQLPCPPRRGCAPGRVYRRCGPRRAG
ncbi:alpha/beta fold hydrolase [Streptomyces sp. NPDC012751]|uniref:alpha/beta fold hydrolase n=1 Tax=Streptomyces sp. NPDC012751 TaxID=3364846 RepID=UPI0036915B34